jgi:hypothetical protein
MRQPQRREPARDWISSGATVTVKTSARRHGLDRYTAYEDLNALGFLLSDGSSSSCRDVPPRPPSSTNRDNRHPPRAKTAPLRVRWGPCWLTHAELDVAALIRPHAGI